MGAIGSIGKAIGGGGGIGKMLGGIGGKGGGKEGGGGGGGIGDIINQVKDLAGAGKGKEAEGAKEGGDKKEDKGAKLMEILQRVLAQFTGGG